MVRNNAAIFRRASILGRIAAVLERVRVPWTTSDRRLPSANDGAGGTFLPYPRCRTLGAPFHIYDL
jgi:hypothetical protein